MAGANKLDNLLDWCIELAIPAVTIWVFSTANRERPPEEVTGILAAVEKKLKNLACDNQFHSRRIRVRAVGRLELLPPSTLAAVHTAEAATKDYSGMHLTSPQLTVDVKRLWMPSGDCFGSSLRKTKL
jgi:short-chain Z-isoprenyl diphosphate synthase